ncbi:hypothetical protein NSERKGN1266_55550 [Nocardia seriolae]|nr:hypothetical protein NSERKGN1266_55550 [Nocardia seriolae]BEK94777.1 hypothetical protein NSER024013_26830 [Nocardia seriolae]
MARMRLLTVLTCIFAIAGMTAGGSSAEPVDIAAATQSIRLDVGTVGGTPRLTLPVTIGSRTLTVMVDTGSTGLRVMADKLDPADVTLVDPAEDYGYGSGTRLIGDIVSATVSIGRWKTATPIEFEQVTKTVCSKQKPNCPAANGGKPTMFGGTYDGIIGLGTNTDSGIGNPLWNLPRGIGRRFAVHYDPAGTSRLLLDVPEKGFSRALMPAPESPPDAGQQPSRPSTVEGCFEMTGLPNGKFCGPTLFDTGAPGIRIQLPPGNTAYAGPVATGTDITLTAGQPTWSTDLRTGPDLHARIDSGPGARSLAGLVVFAENDIRFDLDCGTVGFRSH